MTITVVMMMTDDYGSDGYDDGDVVTMTMNGGCDDNDYDKDDDNER